MKPLVDILKYNGITHYGDQLLLETEPDTPLLDPNTRKYPKELQEISKILPPKATTISTIEYQKEVKRLRESTPSGPSYTNPSMVENEAYDP